MADFESPSPFRVPVALLLGIALPPLGLVVWIGLSGSQRRDYLRSNWVRAGLSIIVASAAPLLLVAAAAALGLWPDPDPNPVGLGLLLLAGSALGTVLSGVGLVLVGSHPHTAANID
jgi:hypothetical protein